MVLVAHHSGYDHFNDYNCKKYASMKYTLKSMNILNRK